MLRLNELTDADIFEMGDEELAILVRREKAFEGISIIPEPEEPEYAEVPEPDAIYYEVGVGYSGGIKFANAESAQRVVDAINAEREHQVDTDYNQRIGYENKYISPLGADEHTIATKVHHCYSRGLYHEIELTLAENERKKAEYEKLKKEYDEAESAASWINEKITEARERESEKREHKARVIFLWDEYLKLADNNTEVAMRFLNKADPEITKDDVDSALAGKKDGEVVLEAKA